MIRIILTGVCALQMYAALPASDNFNRSSLGPNWTSVAGTMVIVGSAAYAANTTDLSAAFWNADSFSANQSSQVTISETSNYSFVGVSVRGSVDNSYQCYASDGMVELTKLVSGVETQLGNSNTYVYHAGDTIFLGVSGTSLVCKINGVVKVTAVDSAIATGAPGIAGYGSNHDVLGDDWVGDDWAGDPLTITPAIPTIGYLGTAYAFTPSTAGGTSPFTWTVSVGSLPTGLSINASTGAIAGTPIISGSYTFVARVVDSRGSPETVTQEYTIKVSTGDIYGGRLDVSCTATGYFHTQKVGNRWWICTPLGHGMFMQSLFVIPLVYGSKYSSIAESRVASLTRMLHWNFNAVGQDSDPGLLATDSVAVKVPFVYTALPTRAAIYNAPRPVSDGYNGHPVDHAVKNIWAAMPGTFYDFWAPRMGDLYDDAIYTLAVNELINDATWKSIHDAPNNQYLVGLSIDDADDFFGFHTVATQHMGWSILGSSPNHTLGGNNNYMYPLDGVGQNLYYGTELRSKTALQTFLTTRYAGSLPACASGSTGVTGLNNCWGSTYTTLGTTGTTVTGETAGTPDDRTTPYTSTLAHLPDRHSISVLVNGTMVAGTTFSNDGASVLTPNVTTTGTIWGPHAKGSITYSSGALSATFSTTSGAASSAILNISTTAGVVTVVTSSQHGLWEGALVNITGTADCNVTNQAIAVVDPVRFTFSGSCSTGHVGALALATVPTTGDTLNVNYTYGGWEHGTGLMDEALNHSWSDSDPTTVDTSSLPANMLIDLDLFLYEFAYYYHHNMEIAVHSVFPNHMYLGIDSIPTDGNTARAPVLLALGASTIDIMQTSYGLPFSEAYLNDIYASYGDKPILDNMYATTPNDSPDYPSYVGIYTFDTHTLKAQAYYNRVVADLTFVNSGGVRPFVGMAYFAMQDYLGEKWGLVTLGKDNSYDGIESVTGTVACSSPLQSYVCGGEAANYTDGVTLTRSANALWLQDIVPTPRTLTRGNVRMGGGVRVTGP